MYFYITKVFPLSSSIKSSSSLFSSAPSSLGSSLGFYWVWKGCLPLPFDPIICLIESIFLQTSIPHPLFEFSPGFIIHVLYSLFDFPFNFFCLFYSWIRLYCSLNCLNCGSSMLPTRYVRGMTFKGSTFIFL